MIRTLWDPNSTQRQLLLYKQTYDARKSTVPQIVDGAARGCVAHCQQKGPGRRVHCSPLKAPRPWLRSSFIVRSAMEEQPTQVFFFLPSLCLVSSDRFSFVFFFLQRFLCSLCHVVLFLSNILLYVTYMFHHIFNIFLRARAVRTIS